MLVVLLGFAAIAVDLSNLYSIQAGLQIAATAAAAAAAIELPDETAAVATAVEFAEKNMPPAAHGNVLVASDVVVGNWDFDTRTFTPAGTPVNAVRLTTKRSVANGNPIGSIFGQFLGVSQHELSADAAAALLPGLSGALTAGTSLRVSGNATVDGDVASNGSVTIAGSAIVDGDVSGEDVTVGGNTTVTGDISTQRRPLDLPEVDKTEISLNNDNDSLPLIPQGANFVSPLDADRNFQLAGGVTYDMPPGCYYFNDLRLTGQSTLNISGPTTICLTGNLDTSGGQLVNSTADSTNLTILMTGGTATLSASTDLYLFLYAPNTDVTLSGDATFIGAIVGKTVTATGDGAILFDENLSEVFETEFDVPNRSTVVQ